MLSDKAEADNEKGAVQRLFFALWPDQVLRQKIKHYCQTHFPRSAGRPVVPENFHITLAFLGNVDVSQQVCVERLANDIQCSPVRFTIDVADYWRKPRILWIGPSEMPEDLVALATELRDGAIECGIQMDMRPYKAHVTVMRKVAQAPTDMKISPFVWQADRFVLVKSSTSPEGVQYQVVREWELGGKA